MRPGETLLWREQHGDHETSCFMISCCWGAELQLRRGNTILLRELYPDKPALYERAQQPLAGSHSVSWARCARLRPLCGPTTSTKFSFGAA
jgi:hypothetical protein